MGASPRRSWLYRSAAVAVTLLAAVLIVVELGWAQFGRKSTVSKGPRALGLIQLTANGKARLTPVAIMVNGKFYDAGSYKATPVPMALDFGIVYEGFRSGVSQGLLTITQPGRLGHIWIAEGTWLPAGSKPPSTHKKAEIPNIEEKDEPPRLHRGDQSAPGAGDQQKSPPPPSAPPAGAPPPPETAKAPPPPPETIEDPNRPVLRRGKPTTKAPQEPFTTFDAAPAPAKSAKSGGAIQFIPAISDAGGPDSRPYTLDVKPEEETTYRTRMLDLAAAELRSQQSREKSAPGPQPAAPTAARHKTASAAPAPKPSFDDVQLRIFDLSNSNEPVLVLSALTHPAAVAGTGVAGPEQEITLIARTNLEGELRKLFFSVTDAQHLYVAPQMELIDAVDADGDGRGELLFRRTFDAGSAYAIYRVTADQLWPLFEGTP
jgi:hypothetical protein